MKKEHKVFVYGTLKQGNPIRGLDRVSGSTFISSAITTDANFMMLDLGTFPGVIFAPNRINAAKIGGELFSVTTDLLLKLDEIEGYPDFYDRIEVETTAGLAWMYVLADTEYAKYYGDITNNIVTINNVTYWNN